MTNFQRTLIPAVTGGCHASNLLQLPKGDLLCAWFGKAEDNSGNISIWLSRLDPGSSEWSQPSQVAYAKGQNCQNPVLFVAPDTGKLWLFHTEQEVGKQEGAVLAARTSDDDGITWSGASYPFGDRRGSLSRQPVRVLDDGTWLLPVFNCIAIEGEAWKGNHDSSSVLYTRDGGKTWHASDVPDGTGLVHMNIVPRRSSEDWVAFFRSRWADNIYRGTSKDGITWSKPESTSLPNPNCGIAASRLPNGKPVLVFNLARADNPTGIEAIWGLPRKMLTVGVSDDDGLTWRHRLLEDFDEDDKEVVAGELSYPSIIVDEGGVMHIAHTLHRKNIKYVRIEDVEGWIAN